MPHINYEYILSIIRNQVEVLPGSKLLDYGCGRGEVIKIADSDNIQVYGADVFDGGVQTRLLPDIAHLFNTSIKKIEDGILDFPDGFFDLVISNQVFEHIDDLENTLQEIYRVMKPGARLITLFPSKEVIREGHIGIPFSHWFPKRSKLRFFYVLILRSIGFGVDGWGKDLSAQEWTKLTTKYINQKTFYLPKKKIASLFDKYFLWHHIESEYIQFRAAKMDNPMGKLILVTQKLPIIKLLGCLAFRNLAGMVISAHKVVSGHLS